MRPQTEQLNIKVEGDIKEEILDHDTFPQQQQQLDPLDIKVEVVLKEEEVGDYPQQQLPVHMTVEEINDHDQLVEFLPVKCDFKIDTSPSNYEDVEVERENFPSSSNLKLDINDGTFILPDVDFLQDYQDEPITEDNDCDPLSWTTDDGQKNKREDDDDSGEDSEIFTYRRKWTYKRITEIGRTGKIIKKYKCVTCGLKSSSRKYLTDHIGVKHYQEDDMTIPIPCGNGQFVYLKKWKYERKPGSIIHKCLTCGHEVTRRQLMLEHLDKVHGQGKPMCQKCRKLFTDESELDSHLCLGKVVVRPRFSMTETGEGKFLFYSKWPVHLDGNFYVCDSCGAKKKLKQKIARHITLMHEDPARHKCDQCHKWFPSLDRLKHHLPVHDRRSRRKSSNTRK